MDVTPTWVLLVLAMLGFFFGIMVLHDYLVYWALMRRLREERRAEK